MTEIILFICSAIGLSHIIVDSKFAEFFRNFVDSWFPASLSYMVHCYACSGFWAGVVCGSICFPLVGWATIGYLLVCGWAGSFLSNFAAMYSNYLDAQSILNLSDEDD